MKLFYIQETDKIKCAHRGLYFSLPNAQYVLLLGAIFLH